jgi:ATP-dependent DNA helicase UvrD/PcrA
VPDLFNPDATQSSALAGLNDAQTHAAAHRAGPLAVLAGPGTGKTRVIIHRIASLITDDGADPSTILALTYTVRAADELRQRLAALIGGPAADRVNAHTFHGFGRRLLLRFRDMAGYTREPQLIDSAQRVRAMREAIAAMGLSDASAARGWSSIADEALKRITQFKNNALTPHDCARFARQWQSRLDAGEWQDDEHKRQVQLCAEFTELANLFERFESTRSSRAWMTFEDLIASATAMLGDHRIGDIIHAEIRHIVVDEFQDVNLSQIEMLRALAPPARRPDLCVVGDDDQSIYLFRGADDLAFHRFKATWTDCATIALTDNYRAAPPLVAVTNATITRATDRFAPEKEIIPVGGPDPALPAPTVECVDLASDHADAVQIAGMIADANAAGTPLQHIAVIARTHGDLARITAELTVRGIPTLTARRPSPADDAGVRDTFAWIELLVNPDAVHAAGRILTRPPFSLDSQQIARLASAHRARRSAHEIDPTEAPTPPSFVRFVEQSPQQSHEHATFARWFNELHSLAAKSTAYDTLFKIVALTGVAYADLLQPAERAIRVSNLVAILCFVHDRQARLDPPNDLASFWSYYQDLDSEDQTMRSAGRDPVEGGDDSRFDPSIKAVRMLTAHASKGLEFDTVFVPRISPGNGYPSTNRPPPNDLPEGLVDRGGDTRDAKARQLAEERRVFYVACTRAERRLVLLARKTKGASKSTHFYQEITGDPTLRDVVQRVDESTEGSHAIADQSPLPSDQDSRSELLTRARSIARARAADALHRADNPDTSAPQLEQLAAQLKDAADQIAIAAHIERNNEPPAWVNERNMESWAAKLTDALSATAAKAKPLFAPVLGPHKLSYTNISLYLDCPKCYYAKYVLGVPDRASASMDLGIIVHAALERFYREWMDADAGGLPMPGKNRLLTIGKSILLENAQHTPITKETHAQVRAQLALAFDKLHDPRAHVIAVETKVRFPYVLDGTSHQIEAKLDRIDQTDSGFRIVDYKTGYASKSKRTPHKSDLQLGIYALALGYHFDPDAVDVPPLPAGVAEYWLLSTGERGVISLDQLDLDKARSHIDQTIQGLNEGHFEQEKRCRSLCDVLTHTDV